MSLGIYNVLNIKFIKNDTIGFSTKSFLKVTLFYISNNIKKNVSLYFPKFTESLALNCFVIPLWAADPSSGYFPL